jgi:formaldehyde-activating enzyme involved in methanogenesis
VGFDAALAAAIIANPESGDDKTLLSVRPDLVPRGIAQHTMVNAIDALDRARKISAPERAALARPIHDAGGGGGPISL